MQIVDFEPRWAEAFRTLNEAWISKYFAIEPKDREVLGDPQGKIIDKGGMVFMALQDGEPVGCVALMKMDDGGYEVAKMTVSETLRGSASSLQAFCGLVSNAVIAGLLSPLLSHSGLHLALGAAVFSVLGWAFWWAASSAI